MTVATMRPANSRSIVARCASAAAATTMKPPTSASQRPPIGSGHEGPDAECDEHKPEHPAAPRGQCRGLLAILKAPPEQRADDPAAVEREGGQEVDNEDRRADVDLVVDEGAKRSSSPARAAPRPCARRRRAATGRAPRSPRVTPRDNGVAELVEEAPGKQCQRAGEGEEIGAGVAQPRSLGREVVPAEGKGDQRDDDEPQWMDARGHAGEGGRCAA